VTKKKTAWEKIEPLIKLNPNSAYVRTALRHFDDEALRRELQRRNATGNDGASRMAQVNDELLWQEIADRELLRLLTRELEAAIDSRNWEDARDVLDRLKFGDSFG